MATESAREPAALRPLLCTWSAAFASSTLSMTKAVAAPEVAGR